MSALSDIEIPSHDVFDHYVSEKKKKLLEINILYLLKGWHAFTFVLVKFDFGEIFNHRSILIVTVQKHVPVLHYALRLGMQ